MNLYESLIRSYNDLSETEKSKIEKHDVDFTGFDGNSETSYLSYVRYILEELKRYGWIKDFHGGDYFNSHMPMLGTYEKMLQRFKNIPREDRYKMSVQQIESIINDRFR